MGSENYVSQPLPNVPGKKNACAKKTLSKSQNKQTWASSVTISRAFARKGKLKIFVRAQKNATRPKRELRFFSRFLESFFKKNQYLNGEKMTILSFFPWFWCHWHRQFWSHLFHPPSLSFTKVQFFLFSLTASNWRSFLPLSAILNFFLKNI